MALVIDNSSPIATFPSCTEVVKVPYTLTCEAVKTARAYLFHDPEASIDGMGKMAGYFDLLVSTSSAAFRGIGYFIIWLKNDLQLGLPKFFSIAMIPFAIIGLVLSFLEIFYEYDNLLRGLKLRWNLNFSKDASKEDLAANLEMIRKTFLELDQKIVKQIGAYIDEKMPDMPIDVRRAKFNDIADRAREIQHKNLVRRISPRLALEIKENLVQLQADLHCNENGAIERARELLNDLDIQTSKKLLVHTVGLFSLMLSAASYALLLVTFPHVAFVAIGLALASIIFYLIRYLIDNGMFSQKGWHFSMDACIPDWAKKIANRISSHGKEVSREHHPLPRAAIQLLGA